MVWFSFYWDFLKILYFFRIKQPTKDIAYSMLIFYQLFPET